MPLKICGIDEAGRGCLAGPVVSAAVIIDKNKIPTGIKDSKQLTEPKRKEFYNIILSSAVSYSIGIASNLEIDKINIFKAAMLSMERAFDGLSVKPDVVIIDGPIVPKGLSDISGLKVIPVIKGDDRVKVVSCASVIAKVFRDGLMADVDEKYPEYGFKKHKGYATVEHKKNIRKYGLTKIHRKTFKF
ncbi:MAG: ribonuclease HII [Deltaproteobacteria bacterium]|jgi:ribonuclease HII|uniref:Ribonuclease HII n=1 Tax=Candidatus Acidulodesulfobacterium acidiphilum TaxID=2597224 RepID=A0A520XGS9_9DELT|nr:ribonuclease HII [Deltaproteobacteria bacterium]RZV40384.1 MAG: ribonuclease HII [Candidatus Acidulodesulfobacterium acidiphilum]